ncbi:MAG: tetratricopeptide repeat protein [Limisphaerales bacterium]
MCNILNSLRQNSWKALALAAFFSASLHAQSPEEVSIISPDLSDQELVKFSKVEPRFSIAAFDIVQSRIITYAEVAATFHGQVAPSNLRLLRTTTPPRSLALTNACSAARLYVDFNPPPEASQGETAVTWNEIGFLVLERASGVLHHYYLAVEYRNGNEPALNYLRAAVRDLSTHLSKRANGALAERLQVTKARYSALWFEKCEEVLPIYKELIGHGARGGIRELLVFRPDLPLVTGWSWEQRKRAESIHQQFVEELSASSNSLVRIEGLLLAVARTRTDKAFAVAFTNALELIDVQAQKDVTRTAYANVLKDLLDDRYSRSLRDQTKDELRLIYEARFVPANERSTNVVAVAETQTSTNAPDATVEKPAGSVKDRLLTAVKLSKPAPAPEKAAVASNVKPVLPSWVPVRPKTPLSWQALLSPADVKYWETMPIIEVRGHAKEGNIVANYYLYLKLRNSESAAELKEAVAALDRAFKAEFPQAQLAHANREWDADERFLWTQRAATTGYPAAQLALGELYILGYGTPINVERGLGLVRAAYDLKVPDSETVLAELYASGIGAPRSGSEKPAALYMAAAHDNHPKAMLELHERYLSGYLMVRDQLEASRWLVNAGLHDKAVLGRYVDEDGKARPQPSSDLDSFAKTLAVYGQAVIHKQPEAIKKVAEWYEHGSVGRKSPVRAYALATLVKDEEKISPQFLDRLKAALTPQELRTAELLMGQWQKVSPDLM